MIDRNHPAVEAATPDIHCISLREYEPQDCHEPIADALNAALPHLTADDLRDTDAAEEIRTEGWLQGWAAGRDLDGDEDATPYLRNTPAGRALMAEGWRAALVQLEALAQTYNEKGDHLMAGDLLFAHERIARHNPYRKENA